MRVCCASGWQEFATSYPWRVEAATTLPRVLLQCLFVILIGRIAGGSGGATYAFAGAVAYVLTSATIVNVADVLTTEKESGTWSRVRSGCLPASLVVFLRAWPHVAQAFAIAAVCIAVVGPVAGLAGFAWRLAPFLPVYALMAVTSTGLGVAGAALAVGKRANLVVGNALSYVVLLAGAVIVPTGRLPWLDDLGSVLPIRHGLEAIRAALAGRPWGTPLLLEAAVGAGWFLLAVVLLRVQVWRARRAGFDDFS
jgi:ABC-2 type transport system permease protein